MITGAFTVLRDDVPTHRKETKFRGDNNMTIFFKRNRKNKAKTRIVTHINRVPDKTPQEAIVSTVLQTPRRDTRREEFPRFDNPAGRF